MPYTKYPTLRNLYENVGWDQPTRTVTVQGAQFQAGKIPGTYFDPQGRHYVTDRSALESAIKAQTQPQIQQQPQQPQNITQEFTPQVQNLLSQIKSYISQPLQTPDELLQSEYGQQLQAAADTMRDQQMRQARAQLAAAGGLYPDDTRAAERFAQVGAEAARMQAAEVLPALMQAAQSQRIMGLNELLSGLGAQSGEEAAALNRALSTFQTYAPYQYLTEYQRQALPIQWAEAIGEVPGGSIPGGGGIVPARQYVEQKGGKIDWRRAPDGGNIVIINGRNIHVEEAGGQNIDGRIYLPQWIIDRALGVA